MVGWHSMDANESWLDGLDWTDVEVGSHAPHKSVAGPGTQSMERHFLPSENNLAEVPGVVLVNLDTAGTLVVTNFRLLFLVDGAKQLVPLGTIPLATIEKFSKQHAVKPPSASRVPGTTPVRPVRRLLMIIGKDMRTLTFGFRPRTRQVPIVDTMDLSRAPPPTGEFLLAVREKRRMVHEFLTRLTRPPRLWDLYAFSHNSPNGGDPRQRLRAEYIRLLSLGTINSQGNLEDSKYCSDWRLCDENATYNICSTYPSLLVMPSSVSDEEVRQAALFRARGRLPHLCWQHPGNGAVLARSSQPLIGIMMNSRSNADEKLVAALCAPPSVPVSQRRKLYIADARPRKNALANGALGGGSESSANYLHCEVMFLGIDNIHAMRDSLFRLREFLDIHGAASSDGSSSLLRGGGFTWGGGNVTSMAGAVAALGDSGWLMHCHTILTGAAWIAARITLEGASVLVHCSDGWDRTTQLTSLASLMLDPYYRTFKGFQALVEKDWLAFGHMFAERMGTPTFTGTPNMAAAESVMRQVGAGSTSPVRAAPNPQFTSNVGAHSPGTLSTNFSPIFLQWMDAVAQLLRVYPSAFEFSSVYLVELMDCVFSCRFGNFLCNSEKERVQAGVADSSGCLWRYLEKLRESLGKEHEHYNLFYSSAQYPGVLLPPAAALAPSLWPQFYLRWSCPTLPSTGGCPPVGWAHGGELETEARGLAQAVLSLQHAKNKAEERAQELMAEKEALLEQLQAEQEGRLSAIATAARACKETAALKQVIEAVGCKIRINNVATEGVNMSDEESTETEGAHTNSRRQSACSADENYKDNGMEEPQLAVSVSMATDMNGTSDVLRRPCGADYNSACRLRPGESCRWPQTGCARMGSAFIGLRADFNALEQLSILDRYFDLEQPDLIRQQPRSRHSPSHLSGVT